MNDQVSSAWGDPNKVQQFRTQALQQGMGIKQVDDYVAQMQGAYQQQAGHQVQNVIGQNQGGMTPDQAKQDPTAALSFLTGGGKLTNTGPDAQAKFISDAQKTLTQAKGKNKYVDPNTYNSLKGQFAATGGDENAFDTRFNQYTDPNKIIEYNTPEGRANQQAYGQVKRQLQDRLDKYNQITPDQKGIFSKAQLENIPVLGALIAPHAYTYDQGKDSFAAQLKGIAGGGQGSGLRVNEAELEKWAKLLPSASDSQTVAHDKLNQLNGAIKSTFNVPSGLDTHYLPSKGRPSLASFSQ